MRKLAPERNLLKGVRPFLAKMNEPPKMRILMYHGVTASCATSFEKQLRYLGTRFRIVPLSTIVHNAANRIGCGETAITFDDGLENNFTVVYPVLKRLSLPATFFVCPGLIDKRAWSWNYEARARLYEMKLVHRRAIARELGAPVARVEKIIEWMKAAPLCSRRAAEARIRAATPNFTATPKQREQFDPMTWEQLASVDPRLISIGSHTLSHPILSIMTDAEIDFEARESRRMLEERLGRSVEFFCYPNGAYNDRVVRVVRKYYRGAVTARPGTIGVGADLYTLPRIPSESSTDLLSRVYQWLRQPLIGSNTRVPLGIVH